jgi:hypothetical protein
MSSAPGRRRRQPRDASGPPRLASTPSRGVSRQVAEATAGAFKPAASRRRAGVSDPMTGRISGVSFDRECGRGGFA